MKIMDDKSIRSALVTTPQPAAGWNEAIKAAIDIVKPWPGAEGFAESEADKAVERVRREFVAALESLRREAPAPAEGVTEILDADKQPPEAEFDNFGDMMKYLDNDTPARPDTAEATLADLIREYANDLRRNSSGSDDYPWDWAKATADYLEVLIDRSSTQREVLCEGAYYLTRGNKNNLRQLVGPLASSTDPEFPWKATVYGSIHRWKSDGTSAESPVRDIVGDPVYAWPNDTAEARLREALVDLHEAILALSKFGKNNVTLFEDSPLENQECLDAWLRLNTAQTKAAEVLGPPFKLRFSSGWLASKIKSDPDIETDTGKALSPPSGGDDIDSLTGTADDQGLFASLVGDEVRLSNDDDPLRIRGTCEDPRLTAAGYKVCGSHGDTEWHWCGPDGQWHDGYRTEYAAVDGALAEISRAGGDEAQPCDCGFSAEVCSSNPCMRKKVHLAGLTPGSKWPNTGKSGGDGATESEGGVEGHAAVPLEIPTQRSGESRDPLGDGSVKVGPHREDAVGIKPDPSEPSPPADRREIVWFDAVLQKLKDWRAEDHEDNIFLSRHEVCTILDQFAILAALAQPEEKKL